jgi:Ser-tRNA(Ala) deacylase AlaX
MNTAIENTMPYFNDSPYTRSLEASVVCAQDNEVLLDRTIFYPTGGGQPGDTGTLTLEDGEVLQVVDTVRDGNNPGLIWHRIESIEDALLPGQKVVCDINWERRYRHMRMHTCLHLLCSFIDAPVTGCSIAEDKGRLDFDLPDSVDKVTVTEKLNHLVNQGLEVRHFSAEPEKIEGLSRLVRTGSVSPPVLQGVVRMVEVAGTDLQPCGGTHVKNTEEIGSVICSRIQKKSRTNRRFTLIWERDGVSSK